MSETKTKRMRLREIATNWDWHDNVVVDAANPSTAYKPDDLKIVAGAMLELLRATRMLAGRGEVSQCHSTLRRIESLLTPASEAKPDPKAARERHLAECRARAWAAYRAAGGTMADEHDDAPGLDPQITVLGLSARARKCLRRLQIETISELVQHTARDLLAAKNFGRTSLAEVRERLNGIGLRLRDDPKA